MPLESTHLPLIKALCQLSEPRAMFCPLLYRLIVIGSPGVTGMSWNPVCSEPESPVKSTNFEDLLPSQLWSVTIVQSPEPVPQSVLSFSKLGFKTKLTDSHVLPRDSQHIPAEQ